MTQANETRVAQLLLEGLERYGAGEVGRAFVLWNEVLELDPGNEEALDYIRDADRRSKPRSGEGAAAMPSVVGDARRLAVSQGEEAALELLQSAPGNVPGLLLHQQAPILSEVPLDTAEPDTVVHVLRPRAEPRVIPDVLMLFKQT